jgi:hypothetical protein
MINFVNINIAISTHKAATTFYKMGGVNIDRSTADDPCSDHYDNDNQIQGLYLKARCRR